MKINIHSHIFTNSYLSILEKFGMLERDKDGGASINESGGEYGYRSEIFDAMWDLQIRSRVMEKLGIELEILSIGNPWLSYIPSEEASVASRKLNAELAGIVKQSPKKFAAIGVLPVTSKDVLCEMEYAVAELGLKGFMMGTHVNGKSIVSEEFVPIFERASRLRVPLYVHPLASPDALRYHDRATVANLIYPMETAIFAKDIVASRFVEKFPNLQLVLAHLGGSVPFLMGRLERALFAGQESSKQDHFKTFFLDSIGYFTPALEFARQVFGAGKIMLGTDFPHIWGDSISRTIEVITQSKLSHEEQDLVFSENAKRVFNL